MPIKSTNDYNPRTQEEILQLTKKMPNEIFSRKSTNDVKQRLKFIFANDTSEKALCVARKKKRKGEEDRLTDRCSTMFALGIVFHNAASSLGDFSSCSSVDITKNLSLITLAA